MNTDNNIEELDLSIEKLEKEVKVHESFKRLVKNKDFKEIIENLYFKENASRLVMLRGDANLDDVQQVRVLNEIDAIGLFRSFLINVDSAGISARQALSTHEDTRAEMMIANSGE